MADFNKAITKILEREGVYSNTPGDKGGETVYGIARNYNPDWEGWVEVDKIKSTMGMNGLSSYILNDIDILNMTKQYYKTKYWDCNRCDELPQDLAERLYDIAVHIGQKQSSIWFQEAINLMYEYNCITVDGKVGCQTMQNYNCIKSDRKNIVLANLIGRQRDHYRHLAENSQFHRERYTGYVRRTLS